MFICERFYIFTNEFIIKIYIIMKSRYNPSNFNRKEMNPEHYKWGLFYFNPDDPRVILPKRAQWMGWTMNFKYSYFYFPSRMETNG